MTEQTATVSGNRPGALRPDIEHSNLPPRIYERLDEKALALRKAWGIYLVLGVLPPIAMILAIFYLLVTPLSWYQTPVPTLHNTAGWIWFLGGMIWISLTVPLGFLIRGRYWSAYNEGNLVGPRDYIMGNLAIWLPLVIAGIAGFVGFATTRYVASLFTSVTAFVIFLSMYPSGHAMTRPVGDHDDPGVYETPT